jgi:hypothetical protein
MRVDRNNFSVSLPLIKNSFEKLNGSQAFTFRGNLAGK